MTPHLVSPTLEGRVLELLLRRHACREDGSGPKAVGLAPQEIGVSQQREGHDLNGQASKHNKHRLSGMHSRTHRAWLLWVYLEQHVEELAKEEPPHDRLDLEARVIPPLELA